MALQYYESFERKFNESGIACIYKSPYWLHSFIYRFVDDKCKEYVECYIKNIVEDFKKQIKEKFDTIKYREVLCVDIFGCPFAISKEKSIEITISLGLNSVYRDIWPDIEDSIFNEILGSLSPVPILATSAWSEL